MGKKCTILVLLLVILVVAGTAVLFYLRHERNSTSAYQPLQGEWTEVNSTMPDTVTFKNGNFLYSDGEKEQKCSFQVEAGTSYGLSLENAMTISFAQDEGPWYGELLYHTQEVDGHLIRILSSFMYEDDGRGLIVACEFVHSDDLQYIGADFSSELYDMLNRRESAPTYVE